MSIRLSVTENAVSVAYRGVQPEGAERLRRLHPSTSVREYVFYVFFFRFQKTWLFTFFFEMTYQKVVKSL